MELVPLSRPADQPGRRRARRDAKCESWAGRALACTQFPAQAQASGPCHAPHCRAMQGEREGARAAPRMTRAAAAAAAAAGTTASAVPPPHKQKQKQPSPRSEKPKQQAEQLEAEQQQPQSQQAAAEQQQGAAAPPPRERSLSPSPFQQPQAPTPEWGFQHLLLVAEQALAVAQQRRRQCEQVRGAGQLRSEAVRTETAAECAPCPHPTAWLLPRPPTHFPAGAHTVVQHGERGSNAAHGAADGAGPRRRPGSHRPVARRSRDATATSNAAAQPQPRPAKQRSTRPGGAVGGGSWQGTASGARGDTSGSRQP